MSDTVTISREEYDALKKDSAFLAALESWGVDNWDGYSEAWREVNGDEEDEDEEFEDEDEDEQWEDDDDDGEEPGDSYIDPDGEDY